MGNINLGGLGEHLFRSILIAPALIFAEEQWKGKALFTVPAVAFLGHGPSGVMTTAWVSSKGGSSFTTSAGNA